MRVSIARRVALGALVLAGPCAASDALNALVTPSSPPITTPDSGIIWENVDASVRPQDDLFAYANGGWLKRVPIPQDQSSWGITEEMTQQALVALRGLLEGAGDSPDPDAQKAARFYASFMDEARLDGLGIAPIRAELDQLAKLTDRRAFSAAFAQFAAAGVNTPIALSIDPDSRHSSRYAVTLSQAGLGMPDRDYYLRPEPRFANLRKHYRDYVERLLVLSGVDGAARAADAVVALETALARAQWSDVENLDPIRTYNSTVVDRLLHQPGGLDWSAYLREAQVADRVDAVILAQPSYFRELSRLVASTPAQVWRNYLRTRLVAARAPYLAEPFADAEFAFDGQVLDGIPDQQPRWMRAVRLVDRAMGDASGRMYVARYFPPETKRQVEQLVHNIIAAYGARLDQLDWMSASTRKEARAKLAKIRVKVGYPERWRDYSSLDIQADDLVGNVRRAARFEWRRNLAKLGRPIDESEWQMTAPTVNAYYDASRNEIVFPAGVLQPPGFVAGADDAFNYGATGATIGHEISHGFDEQGDKFDSDGNLRNWWTARDHRRYAAHTRQLIKQYDAYQPLPGIHVNGALTQGENIADLAGLRIAYFAYQLARGGAPGPVLDGLTADQRFYLGYAQSWLSKRREESIAGLVTSDPHAPERYRVNGVVAQMPSFYDAFDVHPGDGMYLAPSRRITLW